VNFPEQEYTDFFGGTKGTDEAADYDNNTLGLMDGSSKAMRGHATKKR